MPIKGLITSGWVLRALQMVKLLKYKRFNGKGVVTTANLFFAAKNAARKRLALANCLRAVHFFCTIILPGAYAGFVLNIVAVKFAGGCMLIR